MTQASSTRILELDGLRAISVLMVIAFHYVDFARASSGASDVLLVFAALGRTGVHIFFVISGFIITRLMMKEHAEGPVCLGRFYVRRVFRILPAYWFYLGAISCLWLAGVIHLEWISMLYSVLFLSNLPPMPAIDTQGVWFSAHSWSLSVEEQYYLLFPWLIWVLLRGNLPRATVLLTGLFFICAYSPKFIRLHDYSPSVPALDFAFLFEFKYIIAGVLLAFHRERFSRWLRGTSLVVPALITGWEILGFIASRKVPDFWYLYTLSDAPLLALLALWTMDNPERCGALRWKTVQWLGACSYSLYLWQQLFDAPPGNYLGWPLNTLPWSLLLLLACATFSLYAVERPMMRVGRWLAERPAQRRETVLP